MIKCFHCFDVTTHMYSSTINYSSLAWYFLHNAFPDNWIYSILALFVKMLRRDYILMHPSIWLIGNFYLQRCDRDKEKCVHAINSCTQKKKFDLNRKRYTKILKKLNPFVYESYYKMKIITIHMEYITVAHLSTNLNTG